MANIKRTPLNENQLRRLEMVYNIDEDIGSATLCEIEGTLVKCIETKDNSFYPNNDDLDFIINGIKLERNKSNG